ncbi:MAG: 2-C-methyl-D-erythritol 4-phosphate cytidylyltransferase [Clostridium sp.]
MANKVIVLAAGKGKRMGANKNKQFLEIDNKPILYHTLMAFNQNELIDEIILVSAKEEIEYCKKEVVEKYNIEKVKKIVAGGKERQNSVLNGINQLENCEIVLIHDGARPFVDDEIIKNSIVYAKKHGACACGVTPKDTIKIKDENGISVETPDRNNLFAVHTPQSFKYDIITECHRKISQENIAVTDDTMVVEHYGYKVFLYEGSYKNIKITTPEDLLLAEKIIETK